MVISGLTWASTESMYPNGRRGAVTRIKTRIRLFRMISTHSTTVMILREAEGGPYDRIRTHGYRCFRIRIEGVPLCTPKFARALLSAESFWKLEKMVRVTEALQLDLLQDATPRFPADLVSGCSILCVSVTGLSN